MPLPIRDGNQSLTTLSTLIVNSAHVPAHTVVSLGSQAITDIAQAVSGVELGPNTLNALENITVTLGQVTITGGLTDTQLRASPVTIGGSVTSTIIGTPSVTFSSVQISNFPSSQAVTFGTAVITGSTSIVGTPSVTFTQASVTFSSITGSVSVLNLPATQTVTFTQASVTFGAPVVTGSVSVLNFPSTQTIAGTVTANVFGYSDNEASYQPIPVVPWDEPTNSGRAVVVKVQQTGGESLPIYGTVTANLSKLASHASSITKADNQIQIIGGYSGGSPTNATAYPLGVESTGYINSNLRWGGTGVLVDTGASALPVQVVSQGAVTARLQDGSGNNLTSTSIGGVQRLNVSLASAATAGGTLPSFINIHGGTDGSVARTMLLDSSGRTVVTVSNFPATQPVSLASTTVTVSALPSGALTTRFGSVTTANTAQMTSAVTNTSRKYLLAQNTSAGTVTIGIGFSPTTTQGIQLPAGGGLTFDTFCPTGAVYWLGAVTGAAFTILEG